MVNIVIELFLLSIGASFVQRTTGFGFGIFIMTMLPSIMPSYGEATTLSGLLAMTTSLIIVVQKYKYISWSRQGRRITFLFDNQRYYQKKYYLYT